MKRLSKKAMAERLAAKQRRAELLALFKKYEDELVKLDMEPDECPYDDSYIDTWNASEEEKKKARKELWEDIERDGVWVQVSYCRPTPQHRWQIAGSVGGCVGACDGYYEDLKVEAAMGLEQLFQEQAEQLAKRATYAAG